MTIVGGNDVRVGVGIELAGVYLGVGGDTLPSLLRAKLAAG